MLQLGNGVTDTYIDEKLSLEILREDVTDCLTGGRRVFEFANEHSKQFRNLSSINVSN